MTTYSADILLSEWDEGLNTFTVYSSGSTGEPKKIYLDREKIIWSCRASGEFLHVNASEKIYCCIPLDRIGGMMQLFRSRVWRCAIEVVEPSADPMLELSPSHLFTITSLLPNQVYEIFNNTSSIIKLSKFKKVLVGGADIRPQLESKLIELGIDVYHTYGMTETYSHIALRKLGTDQGFRLLNGVEMKTDTEGRLMFNGVITNHHWLQTMDLGEMLSDGTFRILGRWDQIINSGGHKILVESVEKAIEEALNLEAQTVCFVGEEDEKWGQKAVMVYDRSKTGRYLRGEDLQFLPVFDRPKRLVPIEGLPLTGTGKLDRVKIKTLI